LKILSITIQGFRSFRKQQTLDLRDLPIGLHYVTGKNLVDSDLGSNGSGKSSLFEAFTWGFFGKMSTNLKAGDVTSWEEEKPKTTVTIEFEKNDIHYSITRAWSPSGIKLLLTQKEGTSATITQEELETIIGLNFESFLYSVLVSQFTSKFFDLSPADKMFTFTGILGDKIQKWEDYSEFSRYKKENTLTAIQMLSQEIDHVKWKINEASTTNLQEQSDIWEWNKKIEIEEKKAELVKKQEIAAPWNAIMIEIEKKIKAGKKERKELIADIEKDEEAIKKEEAKANHLESEKMGSEIVIGNINLQIEKYKTCSRKGICPFCNQKVAKDHIKKEASKSEKELISISASFEKLLIEINSIKVKIKALIKQKQVRLDQLKSLDLALEEEKTRLSTFEKENARIGIEIAHCEKGILQLVDEKNPYLDMLNKKKAELRIYKRQLDLFEADLEQLNETIEIYKFWQKGFKDIRLMVLEDALKELEININNELQSLGMGDWTIELKIDTETKSGTIKRGFAVFVRSPFNIKPVPFEAWSGGEAQRLKLAGTLGLIDFIHSRRGTDWDIEVYDEPTEWLSQEGIEDLLDNLSKRAQDLGKRIFIIDHRDFMTYGTFLSIITVTKDKEGSKAYKMIEGGITNVGTAKVS